MPNYKALYRTEQVRRLAAENKYDELVKKLRPLLQTIDEMVEPVQRIEQVMRVVGSFHRRRIKEEPESAAGEQSLVHDELVRQHIESAEKHR